MWSGFSARPTRAALHQCCHCTKRATPSTDFQPNDRLANNSRQTRPETPEAFIAEPSAYVRWYREDMLKVFREGGRTVLREGGRAVFREDGRTVHDTIRDRRERLGLAA